MDGFWRQLLAVFCLIPAAKICFPLIIVCREIVLGGLGTGLAEDCSTYQPRPSFLPTAFFCGLMLGAHPPAAACRWSMALVLSSVPVLVLCVRVMMLSLDPGRGCNGCSLQLTLVLTGCSGDIGLPLELRLCFEPCVQCAGQFIGRKTRFNLGRRVRDLRSLKRETERDSWEIGEIDAA